MSLRYTFLFIFIFSHSFGAQAMLIQRGMEQAAARNDADQLAFILAHSPQAPPFFEVAKHGGTKVARVVVKEKPKWKLNRKLREEVLERLILTGNQHSIIAFLDEKVIKDKDITAAQLEFAQERARVSTSNKAILKLLQRRRPAGNSRTTVMKKESKKKKRRKPPCTRKKDAPAPKVFEPQECAVCMDDQYEIALKDMIGLQPNAISLPCEHIFHKACIDNWKIAQRNLPNRPYHAPITCPTCRAVI